MSKSVNEEQGFKWAKRLILHVGANRRCLKFTNQEIKVNDSWNYGVNQCNLDRNGKRELITFDKWG